jgi:hypothetical protein
MTKKEKTDKVIVRINKKLYAELAKVADRMLVTNTYFIEFCIKKQMPELIKAIDMADKLLK